MESFPLYLSRRLLFVIIRHTACMLENSPVCCPFSEPFRRRLSRVRILPVLNSVPPGSLGGRTGLCGGILLIRKPSS